MIVLKNKFTQKNLRNKLRGCPVDGDSTHVSERIRWSLQPASNQLGHYGLSNIGTGFCHWY